jgi:PucR family transcriptional regulator, purine catabolism regulatory protein
MALRLCELLADPSLGLEVVAGRDGIDDSGEIRWAHISDTPDPTPWLDGGEVLLTTGLGVKDDPALQQRLIAGLTARGVVAVGFGVGVVVDAVPDAMLEACDAHRLPLFTVPYEVPFIAITRWVFHHHIEEHYATLRAAVDLHRLVLASVVAEQGVGGVLATVGRAMRPTSLLAVDYAGRELARHDPERRLDDVDLARLVAKTATLQAAETVVDGWVVTVSPVRLGETVEAMVVALSTAPLLEHERLLFQQGLTGVSLELARGMSARRAHRARADELLEEVVAGRVTTASVDRALRRVGYEPEAPYRVLTVALPTGVSDERLCSVVEDALLPLGRPLVGHLDGLLHAVVPDDGTAGERVAEALRGCGWSPIRIGRSRSKESTEHLRSAMREAQMALRLEDPDPVHDIEHLGLPGLLAGMTEDFATADFVTQMLGPLIEHDRREPTPLVDTLRTYLSHGCRPGPAAAELCVHRHTLTYRLDRIRQLTGRDPRAGKHLLEYGLAVALLDQTPNPA